MSRRRQYVDDYAYNEAHYQRLPELYNRLGHRLDCADRDFTEFCHWCREPLAIYELVRDVGQNLGEKATTVTRRLAHHARVPAFLVGWHVSRPPERQARIDALGAEILRLQRLDSIDRVTARLLYPVRKPFVQLTPEQWWRQGVLVPHRHHHARCRRAHLHGEYPVNLDGLDACINDSPIWTPDPQKWLEPVRLHPAFPR